MSQLVCPRYTIKVLVLFFTVCSGHTPELYLFSAQFWLVFFHLGKLCVRYHSFVLFNSFYFSEWCFCLWNRLFWLPSLFNCAFNAPSRVLQCFLLPSDSADMAAFPRSPPNDVLPVAQHTGYPVASGAVHYISNTGAFPPSLGAIFLESATYSPCLVVSTTLQIISSRIRSSSRKRS